MSHVHHHRPESCGVSARGRTLRDGSMALCFLLMAAYVVYTLWSGTLANYLNTQFAWLTEFALLSLCVIGGAKFAQVLRRAEDGDSCHGHAAWWPIVIMLLPPVFGIVIPTTPLGAETIVDPTDVQALIMQHVDMRHIALAETIKNRNLLYSLYNSFTPDIPRTYHDPLQFTLLDWIRDYVDLKDKHALEGQAADMVGFVYHGNPLPGGYFTLTRFFMRHCAFDTIPLGMVTKWNNASALREDSWVDVRGTLHFETIDGTEMLVFEAQSIKLLGQPKTPYLYPTSSMD